MFAKSKSRLNINGILIPPFEIKEGGIVTFEPKYISPKTKENNLLLALSLKSKIEGLYVFTKISISKPYCKKLIKTKISAIPQIEQLIEEAEDKYKTTLKKYFHKTIIFLPGNLRALIALHIACSKSKFIAFDSTGIDPSGEEMLLRYVEKKRKEGWGFLYFKFSITSLIIKKSLFQQILTFFSRY